MIKKTEAENNLSVRIAELVQINNNLEDFVHIVAHDLQGPLNRITAFSALLRKEIGANLNGSAESYLKHIETSAQKGRDLIKSLLTFSRSTNRLEGLDRVDMNDVLGEVLFDLDPTIRQRNAVIKKESRLPTLLVRRIQMAQLFQNLIGNALKYGQEKPTIQISVVEDGAQWVFRVKDNCIGIEKKSLDLIFGLFQRGGDNQKDGSGIGLTICRKIVEGHGGRIWANSTPGKGSTFYFTLPRN